MLEATKETIQTACQSTTSFANMREAQSAREKATVAFVSSGRRNNADFLATKQYWFGQIYLLSLFIRDNFEEICMRCQLPNDTNKNEIANPSKLAAIFEKIAADNTKAFEFLRIYKEKLNPIPHSNLIPDAAPVNAAYVTTIVPAPTVVANTPLITTIQNNCTFYQGDIIALMNKQVMDGYLPITNNAANSNRPGGSIYLKGSLEELLNRHTANSGIALALHFYDVHQYSIDHGRCTFTDLDHKPTVDVPTYQKRYVRWFLTIAANILKSGEQYLESLDFINTLFGQNPDGDRIFLEMQNNVYQVPPDSGLIGIVPFFNPTSLTTLEALTSMLNVTNISLNNFGKVLIVSAAAPDKRSYAIHDRNSTSDTLLQAKKDPNETLKIMIESAIDLMCEQAFSYQEQGLRPIINFMLPGCGAFRNSVDLAGEYFISRIKEKIPALESRKIPFNIVEYNPKFMAKLIAIAEKKGLTINTNFPVKSTHNTSNEWSLGKIIVYFFSLQWLNLFNKKNKTTHNENLPLTTASNLAPATLPESGSAAATTSAAATRLLHVVVISDDNTKAQEEKQIAYSGNEFTFAELAQQIGRSEEIDWQYTRRVEATDSNANVLIIEKDSNSPKTKISCRFWVKPNSEQESKSPSAIQNPDLTFNIASNLVPS